MSEEEYVFVCMDESAKEEGVELPVEADGTLLLSVLQSQFNGASGLKYRNPVSGSWRAIKMADGLLRPPEKGWETTVYVVVITPSKEDSTSESELETREKSEEEFMTVGYSSDSYKRKLEDSEGQRASKNPRSQSPDNYTNDQPNVAVSAAPTPATSTPAFGAAAVAGGAVATAAATGGFQNRNQEDVIILGLEWTVTDDELRGYFEQFGAVAHCEVKKEITGKSRGFGFVRFFDRVVQANVFGQSHAIKGRRVELKYPKQSGSHMPNKLFIGCLPLKPEVSKNELSEHFSQFGRLTDVYIPMPYRGFGFVTYADPVVAQKVVNMRDHSIRKSNLNVSFADPRGGGGGGMKAPHFPTDSYLQQLGYSSGVGGRQHPGPAATARYPFSAQQQPQQTYAMGYGTPQHVAAIQRPDTTHNMGSVHAVPVSGTPGMSQASAGLYAVSYGNGQQQQQQQTQQPSYVTQSPGSYR